MVSRKVLETSFLQALAGDPLGGFNLTDKAYSYCLQQVMQLKVPMLVLGGGGYNHPNAARLWASLSG
jgi:acetoin utilization deacetylase AcuC-like enzyme